MVRVSVWKIELQKFADATGMIVHVHHYPPGTSKWNKIEHRLFCHITQTWRGRPLTDRLAVVELIAATTTTTGLRVESALDTRTYEKGIKVTDAEMDALDITGDAFHPEWNDTIRPRSDLANRSSNVAGVLSTAAPTLLLPAQGSRRQVRSCRLTRIWATASWTR